MSSKLTRLFRGFVICLAAACVAAIPLTGLSAEREIRYLPFTFTVDVYATGHIHGHIINWDYAVPQTSDIGLSKVYTLIKEGRAANNRNLLLDAGSLQYGSAMTFHYAQAGFKGIHPMIKASNFMFYDALVLGELDFDYGTENLAKAIAKSNAPVLAANIYDAKTGKPWDKTKPYLIKTFEIGDKANAKVKVGIIGVTDKDSLPENEALAGLNITDQVEAVKKYTQELQGQKVDAIIVVTHSGLSMVSGGESDDDNQVIAIAKNCPGINLIISSHRYAIIDEANPIIDRNRNVVYERARVNGVPILSSGQNGAYLGKASLVFEMFGRKYWLKSVSTANLSAAGVTPDKGLSDMAWPYHDSTLQANTKVLGYAEGDFISADVASRNMVALGFLNQVQLYFSQAQLSAASLFNLDPKLKQGAITVQDVNTFYPFDTYLYAIEISGGQLKKYLENATRYFRTFKEGDRVIAVGGDNDAIGEFSYDIVQGVNYVIDITRPAGERVIELTYQGRPVDDNEFFTIALSSSRYNGAGGYMTAMGFDKNNPPKVVFESKSSLGENGRIKALISQYIKEKRTIKPEAPTNFKVVTEPFQPVTTRF